MKYSEMPIEQIKSRLTKTDSNGCWNWLGAKTNGGYGNIALGSYGKKRIVAHKFFYEKEFGEVEKGKQLDHICRNRSCVNPKHLRQLTCRENVLCGEGISAVNARKTHCHKGHELSIRNVNRVKTSRGYQRRCKTCLKLWTKLKGRQKQTLIKLANNFVDEFLKVRGGWKEELEKNNY